MNRSKAAGPGFVNASIKLTIPMLLRRLFAVFCTLIALVPMVVAAICLATLHRPLFYLIDIFTLPALSLTVVMAVGFLALRQPVAAGACTAAALVFFVAFGPQALPRNPPAAPGKPSLRMVFANLYVYNPHPERLIGFVEAQNPDIIATVETSERGHMVLLPSLEARYPYHAYFGQTSILSRFPIANVENNAEPVSLLTADISTPSGIVHLGVTHFAEPLPLGNPKQGSQAQYIESNAEAPGQRNTVIVGDFNSDFSAFRLQEMAAALGLHALGAPSGSWPTFLPSFFRIAIDNAMAGDAWHFSHRAVSRPFGSDHRAIAFTLSPAR